MRVYLADPDFGALARLNDAGHEVALAEPLTEVSGHVSADEAAALFGEAASEEIAVARTADAIVYVGDEPDPYIATLAQAVGVPLVQVDELLDEQQIQRAVPIVITKKLIVTALVQVVSISLGMGLGYLAFLYAVSILDQ